MPKVCDRCGQQYDARSAAYCYCPACRPVARRERKVAWQRQWRGTRYGHPCPGCGRIRYDPTGVALCAGCRGRLRRRGALRICWWCGRALYRQPWQLRRRRFWCSECVGAMSAYARGAGVSRQRVAQSVARERELLATRGVILTPAEALARVNGERQRRSALRSPPSGA